MMNREIKFRAWDKINKKMWLSGEEGEDLNGWVFQTYFDRDGTLKAILYSDQYQVTDDPFPMYDNDEIKLPIMQYIGLKNKSDKEIYDGDILSIIEKMGNSVYAYGKSSYNSWTNEYKHVVEFTPPDLQRVSYFINCAKCDVIGNIYENPELL